MQIVIDIPEEDYNFVKKQVADGITNPLKICIANGTPLPKGHGRLIDESDLIPDSDYEDGMFYAVSIGAINGAPTIIEADMEESRTDNKSDDELYADAIDAFKIYATGRK